MLILENYKRIFQFAITVKITNIVLTVHVGVIVNDKR
jgi:hypothetical protein